MLYRIIRFIDNIKRWAKHFLQKTTRMTHTSDFECWGLSYTLAKFILPKLKQFKKANVNSYPSNFSKWEDNESFFGTKEVWEKNTADAQVYGFEMEGWHKVIDEMIFAFEYVIANDDETFRVRHFVPKYGDVYAKKPENKHTHSYYRNIESGYVSMFDGDISEPPEGFESLDKDSVFAMMGDEHYYDIEMERKFAERADKGFELFGKYFRNLWD